MKTIILSGKFGMGHLSAAKALQKQIEQAFPQHQTILADLYEIAFPKHCHTFYNSYTKLMLKGGKIINAAYKNAVHDDKGLPKPLNNPDNFLLKKLSAYLQQQQPDLVITTYSLASRLVSDHKKLYQQKFPHITCITDIGIHNVWINPDTALYLAASRETKGALIRQGIPDTHIAVSGIPVAREFREYKPGHLYTDQPRELLLMGGGLGMLPESKSFYRQLSQLNGVHTTIICGHNDKLYHRLLSQKLPNLDIIGCCDDVPERMAKADLLLSKPGGITTFEAIYSQLPMLMFQPSLQQEIKNCQFILRNGLGELLFGSKTSYAWQISKLIRDDFALGQMQKAMRQLQSGYDGNAVLRFIAEQEARLLGRRVG